MDALNGRSPLDGAPLSPIRITPRSDVESVVEWARRVQPRWGKLALEERVKALRVAAKWMLDDRHTGLSLMRAEAGKLEADALMSETLGPLDQVNAWARVVRRATGRRRVRLNPVSFPKKRAYVELVPRGVVGCITPWNYPMATFYRPVLPALLCGNAVVVKPSEYTPRTAEWFVGHLQAALPDGLISVVQGGGDVGQALIEAGIDACTFTGSVATGRRVAELCAKRMIPVNVEMGGKDVAIVLEDCALSRTAAGLTHWALHNAGQACSAIEVACVQKGIADDLVLLLQRTWSRLRCANGNGSGVVDVSPLSTERQLEIVEAHVEDARQKGAKVLCGGRRTGVGLGYEATLLDHCSEDMRIVREETFGPVLALVRIAGTEDAVRLINGLDYGLTASIWSSDVARAERLASRLEVGVVTVNNHSITGAVPGLPWSGTRNTGFGVSNHELALGTFARPRTLLIDESSAPEPFWMPFDERLVALGNILSDVQLGRLGRAWKLPKLLRDRVAHVRRFFEA